MFKSFNINNNQNLKRLLIFISSFFLLFIYWKLLPDPLFKDPVSVVLEDKDGKLLSAKIAEDEQWRFPHNSVVPEKFVKLITTFEDKRFFYHFGVDPFAALRALKYNLSESRVVSGASTISMQVIRLARKGQERDIIEKIIEAFLAVRMEVSHTKNEIISLYASNAPFGGNVVGLDAASWRYFGRDPEKLSWAETAMLAVLPNNPALIHPGRNRTQLKKKRDSLLKKIFDENIIDKETYQLAILEPLPTKPKRIPAFTPHLQNRISAEFNFDGLLKTKIKTTIDINLQKEVQRILHLHNEVLSSNSIYNGAILVAENKSGNVLAYVGNTDNDRKIKYGNDVDIITSPRSSGSILKPFLYTALFNDGTILSKTLVEDVPTKFSGYQPVNFNKTYDGAVPADQSLSRSLNIPAVKLLKEYGVPNFHHILKKLGISTLDYHPSHYGLSLILGGAEVTLWDIAGVYSSLCRVMLKMEKENNYSIKDYKGLNFLKSQTKNIEVREDDKIFNAASIWQTFEALSEAKRPEIEGNWKYFESSQKIAWKTGTSFGFRDAWAVGCTRNYTIAVWAGNADGTGRPNLTGLSAAAPILFDVLDLLPVDEKWFDMPEFEMIETEVCSKSGHKATEYCSKTELSFINVNAENSEPCPYHKEIFLDVTEKFQVNSSCYKIDEMKNVSWFILPPKMEWFYKKKNSDYKSVPPYLDGCKGDYSSVPMQFIYPTKNIQIFVPIEIDGKKGKTIFEVAHRYPRKKVYWHIDDEYVATTNKFHQIESAPSEGKHKLTVVDEDGYRLETTFYIVN